MKICNKCKIEKEDSQFYRHSSTKDGLNTVCRDCFKDYFKRNIKSRFSTIYGDTKRCNVCHELLPIDNFYASRKTGYVASTCKKCRASIRLAKYIRKTPAISDDGTRLCMYCKQVKDISDFVKNSCRCKSCNSANRRQKMYGITRENFNDMMHDQNYKCAICGDIRIGKENSLCVDHCHKTNNIRGLLCNHCNTALGKFEDNVEILQNAINYLKNSQN